MIKTGNFSNIKPNFWFTHSRTTYIRHSESSIKRVVKELNLKYADIYRDKGCWIKHQHQFKITEYFPKY